MVRSVSGCDESGSRFTLRVAVATLCCVHTTRVAAVEYDIKITGMAAVIGEAKKRRLIPSARAIFEQLHESDFRISQGVIKAVLARAGEHLN